MQDFSTNLDAKEKLRTYLRSYRMLSEAGLEQLLTHFSYAEISNAAYYAMAGKSCNMLGFVLDGIFRVFHLSDEGSESTRHFIIEEQFVTDIDSFLYNKPCASTIQAILPARVLQINKHAFTRAMAEIPGLADLLNKLVTQELIKKLTHRSPLVNEDATTRYLNFMQEHREVLRRVPLSYIASYLGITPQSLSRIRASLE